MTGASLSPTGKQLVYLRRLAESTGTTFVQPKTRTQASREIDRMIRLQREKPSIYNRDE